MSLPIASTTISVLRPTDADPDGWPATEPSWGTVATGIRAVISSPGGTVIRNGSVQAILGWRLAADPCDLQHIDRVQDERTQDLYEVNWVYQRTGFGLEHCQAELRRVEGPPL